MINFLAILYIAIFSAVMLKVGEKPYLEGALFKYVSIFQMVIAFILVFSIGMTTLFLKNKFFKNPALNKKWNGHNKKYKLCAIIFGLLVFITYLIFLFIEIFVFK
jgi:hypothetical protein